MLLLPGKAAFSHVYFFSQSLSPPSGREEARARLSLLPHKRGTVSTLIHYGRLPGPVTAVAPVVIALILLVPRSKQNPAAQPLSIHSQKAVR